MELKKTWYIQYLKFVSGKEHKTKETQVRIDIEKWTQKIP